MNADNELIEDSAVPLNPKVETVPVAHFEV